MYLNSRRPFCRVIHVYVPLSYLCIYSPELPIIVFAYPDSAFSTTCPDPVTTCFVYLDCHPLHLHFPPNVLSFFYPQTSSVGPTRPYIYSFLFINTVVLAFYLIRRISIGPYSVYLDFYSCSHFHTPFSLAPFTILLQYCTIFYYENPTFRRIMSSLLLHLNIKWSTPGVLLYHTLN